LARSSSTGSETVAVVVCVAVLRLLQLIELSGRGVQGLPVLLLLHRC
jgi:hypothetical protein